MSRTTCKAPLNFLDADMLPMDENNRCNKIDRLINPDWQPFWAIPAIDEIFQSPPLGKREIPSWDDFLEAPHEAIGPPWSQLAPGNALSPVVVSAFATLASKYTKPNYNPKKDFFYISFKWCQLGELIYSGVFTYFVSITKFSPKVPKRLAEVKNWVASNYDIYLSGLTRFAMIHTIEAGDDGPSQFVIICFDVPRQQFFVFNSSRTDELTAHMTEGLHWMAYFLDLLRALL